MLIAGIGCRRGCPAEDILAVLTQAGGGITALAAPVFKAGEAGLIEAARRRDLPLVLIDDAGLAAAQPGCVTFSAAALAATGHASIAEAACLAAAGPGAVLVQPRISLGAATCALARPA